MNIISKPKGNYVYVLYRDLKPIYVGKGSGGRVLTGQRKFNWDGYRIVAEDLPKEESFELEKLIIQTYGYENLENKEYSEEEKTRRSEWCKTQSSKPGHLNPRAKKVSVLGIDFGCLQYAADAFGVSRWTMRRYVNN